MRWCGIGSPSSASSEVTVAPAARAPFTEGFPFRVIFTTVVAFSWSEVVVDDGFVVSPPTDASRVLRTAARVRAGAFGGRDDGLFGRVLAIALATLEPFRTLPTRCAINLHGASRRISNSDLFHSFFALGQASPGQSLVSNPNDRSRRQAGGNMGVAAA